MHVPPRPDRDGTGPEATLSRSLADFLVEFSIVLHKRSLYPPGHPFLEWSAVRFADRLERLLGTRESVTLGVARAKRSLNRAFNRKRCCEGTCSRAAGWARVTILGGGSFHVCF